MSGSLNCIVRLTVLIKMNDFISLLQQQQEQQQKLLLRLIYYSYY